MCGMVARLGSNAAISEPLRMLSHRGVRDRIVQNKWGSIGHTRLPIVGVGPENDQPRNCWPWTIAFVGEVLDFRDDNAAKECDFDTVETAWHIRGPAGLKLRDGFWSILAIDDRDGSLHVLCDYLAQKPMYYRTDSICAASEPDAVACVAPVTIDEVYMSAVIKWGYCPDTRRTPYREIKRVLPGEHVKIGQDKSLYRQIADPLEPASLSDSDLRDEIVAAVRRRTLSSDVPVAALVSGGLDSSIVFALASEFGDVKGYNVVVPSPMSSAESAALDKVTSGRAVQKIPSSAVHFGQAIDIMQEPVDLGSLVPQISLSECVRETVCLTGDGADELFGGYSRALRYDSQASDVWQELVAWHLPRLDRVMMRNRIEVRSPFLARRVAAAALALPWSKRNNGKQLLKYLFSDVVPQQVLDLPKMPLRTMAVDRDRERNSAKMVEYFRSRHKQRAEEAA